MELPQKNISLFTEYLNILEVSIKEPSLIALRELIESHLINIPFENISKLYNKKKYALYDIPNFEQYIDGIKKYKFGGTCYSNNYYFNKLLEYLGYNVILCGADMKNPDVHIVSIVKPENQEFIIDVGYAAPFFEPLPRNISSNYQISFGKDKYILFPQDSSGFSQLNFYRNDSLKHSYVVKPHPKSISDFTNVIKDSFSQTSTFMNSILLVIFKKNYFKAIHNFTLIEYSNNNYTKREISNKSKLAQEIETEFGMPSEIAYEALAQIINFIDAWN